MDWRFWRRLAMKDGTVGQCPPGTAHHGEDWSGFRVAMWPWIMHGHMHRGPVVVHWPALY